MTEWINRLLEFAKLDKTSPAKVLLGEQFFCKTSIFSVLTISSNCCYQLQLSFNCSRINSKLFKPSPLIEEIPKGSLCGFASIFLDELLNFSTWLQYIQQLAKIKYICSSDACIFTLCLRNGSINLYFTSEKQFEAGRNYFKLPYKSFFFDANSKGSSRNDVLSQNIFFSLTQKSRAAITLCNSLHSKIAGNFDTTDPLQLNEKIGNLKCSCASFWPQLLKPQKETHLAIPFFASNTARFFHLPPVKEQRFLNSQTFSDQSCSSCPIKIETQN